MQTDAPAPLCPTRGHVQGLPQPRLVPSLGWIFWHRAGEQRVEAGSPAQCRCRTAAPRLRRGLRPLPALVQDPQHRSEPRAVMGMVVCLLVSLHRVVAGKIGARGDLSTEGHKRFWEGSSPCHDSSRTHPEFQPRGHGWKPPGHEGKT